jgi:hypothetical protein
MSIKYSKACIKHCIQCFSMSKGLELPSKWYYHANGHSNLLLNNIICHGKIMNIFYHNKNHDPSHFIINSNLPDCFNKLSLYLFR